VLLQERKQHRHDGWDEGVILEFMNMPETRCYTVDLTGGGKLTLFTQDPSEIQSISQQTNALFSWLGTPPNFHLKLWWRDDPRYIQTGEWPSKRTVNGGWTHSGSDTIHVYRSEEWDRVLIHEAIHALEWDWVMPSTALPCWNLQAGSQLSPALFEAWTELYAEWLYCGWHNIPWETQRAWQIKQAQQILARTTPAHKWSENTNIFAYYILKAALAPHIGFLWVFGNGLTEKERNHVLCTLVSPELQKLRSASTRVSPEPISMRMTVPKK